MKDFEGKIKYKDTEYSLVFNLNVMEEIQAEYGSLDEWGKLTDGTATGEVDAKAVIFGFTQMINEGIDITNETDGTDIRPLTKKQVGRMLTEVGLAEATNVMNKTVIESTKDEGKNE